MKRILENFSRYYFYDDGTITNLQGRIIKDSNCRGYRKVLLTDDNGKQICNRVHRFIAKAFPEICGKWFDDCEIDHINGIKNENRATNLRVCTHKQNMQFYFGVKPKKFKLVCPKAPVSQYTKNGDFIKWYPSAVIASKTTGICKSSIIDCYTHPERRKSAGKYVWKLAI